MRVVGVHPAREPVLCGTGPLQIGSAPDDTIVPIGASVAPHHVSIVADDRGLVLTVRQGCQRVYVNARAVRERALLRYGDTVTLGSNKFLVTTDSPPPAHAGEPAQEPGPVVLRIVSGAASGQALAVERELRLGAGSPHFGDLAYACRVVQVDGGLSMESASAAPRVNGWRCSRARLQSNDQVVLGEHRLVVEAPALQFAAHVASLPPPQVVERRPVEPEDDGPHTEVWWLIVAAAVLAAVIALFLYFRW